MKFKNTDIEGLKIISLNLIEDNRGFFSRVWCKTEFRNENLCTELEQINLSYNIKKGTVRGMHFQYPPYSEIKLVRCIKGKIFDVAVDLRHGSKTFAKWYGLILSSDNKDSLYIPEGFAHGYQSLTENTEVMYQVNKPYTKQAEGGIVYNDDQVGINWPVPISEVSDRDQNLPPLRAL